MLQFFDDITSLQAFNKLSSLFREKFGTANRKGMYNNNVVHHLLQTQDL